MSWAAPRTGVRQRLGEELEGAEEHRDAEGQSVVRGSGVEDAEGLAVVGKAVRRGLRARLQEGQVVGEPAIGDVDHMREGQSVGHAEHLGEVREDE